MVRAIDNKDRWLASIDLANAKLQPRHRLTDPAWINWGFNDFGFAPDGALWFLSEESGYSHLYVSDARRRAARDHLGQVGNLAAAIVDGRQPLPVPVQSRVAGRLRSLRSRPQRRRGARSDGAGWRRGFRRLARRIEVAGAPFRQLRAAATRGGESQRRRPGRTHRHAHAGVQGAHVDRAGIRAGAVEARRRHDLGQVLRPEAARSRASTIRSSCSCTAPATCRTSATRYPNYFREQMFHNLLVDRGYIVLDLDYRASEGYGRKWRTDIYRRMGTPELEDYLDGLDWIVANKQGDRDARRHLWRQLWRLHGVHGVVQEAGRVQGRRRAAPGDRLVAVQPRVHRRTSSTRPSSTPRPTRCPRRSNTPPVCRTTC